MDKETLSNYGWIVICILVLSVMIALATPFGTYISNAVKSTTEGLFDVQQKAMGAADIEVMGQEFEDYLNGGGSVGGYDHNAPELHPDDGTGVYDGMIYTSGNYEYRYGYKWCTECEEWSSPDGCGCKETCDGWAVRCINNVADPGHILESINGEPVTSMISTFAGCTSLTTAPAIPSSVTNMQSTFYNCKSLTTAPAIPSSVTNMSSTFAGCTSLATAPTIPSSVTDMSYTFMNCTSLTTAPVIPSSVTNMSCTFAGCTSLTTAPTIPSSVTNMNSTFQGCTSLTAAPVIPSSVTNMYMTFYDCTSLTTAPAIPSSVTNMMSTFAGCTSLTGAVSIPCSLASKNYTYTNCPTAITYYHIDGCDGSCGK